VDHVAALPSGGCGTHALDDIVKCICPC
jgi:hypothetical protein